jgi:hypothetical protein
VVPYTLIERVETHMSAPRFTPREPIRAHDVSLSLTGEAAGLLRLLLFTRDGREVAASDVIERVLPGSWTMFPFSTPVTLEAGVEYEAMVVERQPDGRVRVIPTTTREEST